MSLQPLPFLPLVLAVELASSNHPAAPLDKDLVETVAVVINDSQA
jgi:hypothetical protein